MALDDTDIGLTAMALVLLDKRYGYSKVEQLIVTINIGLRRQMFQLNYYTDVNMPEATLKLIRAYLEESE
jgi:hypothetical protein